MNLHKVMGTVKWYLLIKILAVIGVKFRYLRVTLQKV